MMRRAFRVVFAGLLLAVLLMPARAMAQTIAWSQQNLPDRILPNGTDLGVSTRPVGLNPDGINFQDCYTDQTLRFYLIASGFTSGIDIGVFATISGTCTNQSELDQPGSIDCWNLGTTLQSVPASVSTPLTINVRVQDLVAYQSTIPQTETYTPQGASACTAQTTTAGTSLTIWFVPLESGTVPTGTALSYPIATDLVGPAPPADVKIGDGDQLMVVKWTPNSDTVTQGYNVYVHELGSADAGLGSRTMPGTVDAELICNGVVVGSDEASTDADTTSSVTVPLQRATAEAGDDAEAEDGAADDATTDAASDGSFDATLDASADATTDASSDAVAAAEAGTDAGQACYYRTSASNTGSSKCTGGQTSDPVLSVTINSLNTTASSTVTENEAGEVVESEDAGTAIVGGGNSGVDTQYLQNASAGETVSGESRGSYTVTGLQNGVYYAVAVSAVDAFGNVGPPSTPQACDYPAPVNDFWTVYRNDGGGAGGGFCSLEAVGAPAGSAVAFGSIGAIGVALLRRRRRGVPSRTRR
jgi:hypothetical protein